MKVRVVIVALLASSMAVLGVGCTPPTSDWQARSQATSIGNLIGLMIVVALCGGTSFCPIGGAPVQPSPPPAPDPAPALAPDPGPAPAPPPELALQP